MSHLPPATHEPRGRDPWSVDARIISVFGVILGTLGLSCLPFNFGFWVVHAWPVEPGRVAGSGQTWVLLSTLIGLGLATLLLISSLAAYRFLWWGRDGLILWAILSLIYCVVGIFFWGKFLFPQFAHQFVLMRGPDELGGLLAWLIGSIFAILTLWHLTRPAVREAFIDTQFPVERSDAA
jgi:magnesium-transporting ATPase (P-type)